ELCWIDDRTIQRLGTRFFEGQRGLGSLRPGQNEPGASHELAHLQAAYEQMQRMLVVVVALSAIGTSRLPFQLFAIYLVPDPKYFVLQFIRVSRDDFEILREGLTKIEYFG